MPLPPQGTFPFSMLTANLMLSITLLIQGLLIALSTRVIKDYKGVRAAAIATLTLAGSYYFIYISPGPGPGGSNVFPFLVQLFSIFSYFLIYLAICRFIEKPFNKIILYGFAPFSLLALILATVINFGFPAMKVTALITGAVMFAITARELWSGDTKKYKLSANLTALTLLAFSLTMLYNVLSAMIAIETIMPGGTLTEKVQAIIVFIASYLWSGGFIFMVSQRLQSDLNDLALNDALTRVRNRRAMDNLLEFEMERVENEVGDFSIVLIDIDHFKLVNDTYGHHIGDQVLQWFAATLQHELRMQDIFARWGGEEFMILLPETRLNEASEIAERLRQTIETTDANIPDESIKITFSAGISSSTKNRDVKDLCKVADLALYIAKQTRNRVATQNEIPGDEIAG